jgi:hypothetical protein
VCSAALATARAHKLPHELLTGAQVNARFPGERLLVLGCLILAVAAFSLSRFFQLPAC